jgi:hypothetical protein
MPTNGPTILLSFLTAGPRLQVHVPEDFPRLPMLSSPIANRKGGRSYDFLPASMDDGVTEETRVLSPLADREGRTVEMYERVGTPPQWYLRWLLTNGTLYTHLREEDGVAVAGETVAALAIIEDETTGLPFLLPESPLRRWVSAVPGYHEEATFDSVTRNATLTLQRPGFVAEGQMVVVPAAAPGDRVVLRAGASNGIEARLSIDNREVAAGRELLAGIVDSLVEA